MGYYSDIRNSQYAAKDTALINRMNGVSNHSAIGAMLATQAPNAIMNILSGNSIFGNLTLKKNSASEEEAIQDIQKEQETNQQISDIKDFNKIKRNIFKKLKISRTIQILSAAIRYNII